MKQQLQFEEAEKILSWREMRPGVFRYYSIEYSGTNDYGKPISVVTLGHVQFYATPSLYWELKRRPETKFKIHDGLQTFATGYEYPVFKFAK